MGLFTVLNKTRTATNLSWMQVDIHSHILPGIDDGSPNVEASIGFLNRLRALGLTVSFATPHVFKEMYPNDAETIGTALRHLQTATKTLLPEFQLDAAAEYMMDTDFVHLYRGGSLLTLPGNHVLVEMSYAAENPEIDRHLFELQVNGYTPILAHPERYVYYHDHPERYQRLKDQGCLFQLNLLSPSGYYGTSVRKAAKWLLKRGMADLVGTDLHHAKHLAAIERFVLGGDAHGAFMKNPIRNKELFGA